MIYNNTSKPLFIAQGRTSDKRKIVVLLNTYEEAQKKAKEMIHQCYSKVSAYRAGEK